MAKNYMPQRIFNFGAAMIANLHLFSGRQVRDLTSLTFSSYRDAYVDDDTEHDWADAAQWALDFLREREATAPERLLENFMHFVDNYRPDGRPRKKRLFGGVWFNKAEQNLRRKEDFYQLLKFYYIGAQDGIVPLAPHGWLERRSHSSF